MPIRNSAHVGGNAIRGQLPGNISSIAEVRNLLAIMPEAQVIVEV
jgi:hypothetical protein